MPVFILLASALLVFAVTIELLASNFQPATLIALFLSLPASQQIAWLLICLVLLSLIVVALVQYCKLREKSKAADVLETRLRSARDNVLPLEHGQKNTEQAVQYLDHSDPEGPSRPGEFHPESLTDPDLILSHHPARATARRLPPSIEHRVPPVAG